MRYFYRIGEVYGMRYFYGARDGDGTRDVDGMSDIHGTAYRYCLTDVHKRKKFAGSVEVDGVADVDGMRNIYGVREVNGIADADGIAERKPHKSDLCRTDYLAKLTACAISTGYAMFTGYIKSSVLRAVENAQNDNFVSFSIQFIHDHIRQALDQKLICISRSADATHSGEETDSASSEMDADDNSNCRRRILIFDV